MHPTRSRVIRTNLKFAAPCVNIPPQPTQNRKPQKHHQHRRCCHWCRLKWTTTSQVRAKNSTGGLLLCVFDHVQFSACVFQVVRKPLLHFSISSQNRKLTGIASTTLAMAFLASVGSYSSHRTILNTSYADSSFAINQKDKVWDL